MDTIIEFSFKDGDVTVSYKDVSISMVHQYVISTVEYILGSPPAIEQLVSGYSLIELMFLVAMYMQKHKSLSGFHFPDGYDCPDFEATFYLDDEADQPQYHIIINCASPTDHYLVVVIIAGILLGVRVTDLALTHLAVHDVIYHFVEAAYQGGESDESSNFTYS